MITPTYRDRIQAMITQLEAMRVRAVRIGPAAAEILPSIDEALINERRELAREPTC